MKCKLCGAENAEVIYHGVLRYGAHGSYTPEMHDVWQCPACKTIWNNAQASLSSEFYESEEYRTKVDGSAEAQAYYTMHDGEVLEHLNYTGTSIFRDKVVADIGCAGGSFLDFVSGVAKKVIAIEPSKTFQKALSAKGYEVFPYTNEAVEKNREWGGADVITSWDVIEHVGNPWDFAKDMYNLSSDDGKIIVGTPTDYPVLRKMLGDEFNKFVFMVQHPWIFSKESLGMIYEKAGYKNIKVEVKQKYGIGNLLSWLYCRKPCGDTNFEFISDSLNELYKQEMGRVMGEYLVLYAEK